MSQDSIDVIGNQVFGIRDTDFSARTAMQTTGRPYSRSRLMGPRPAKASSLAVGSMNSPWLAQAVLSAFAPRRTGSFAERRPTIDVIRNQVFGIRNTDFSVKTRCKPTGRPYSR